MYGTSTGFRPNTYFHQVFILCDRKYIDSIIFLNKSRQQGWTDGTLKKAGVSLWKFFIPILKSFLVSRCEVEEKSILFYNLNNI